jgi:hypothetical protein
MLNKILWGLLGLWVLAVTAPPVIGALFVGLVFVAMPCWTACLIYRALVTILNSDY